MRQVKILQGPFRFPAPGVRLGLDENQVRRRRHLLKDVSDSALSEPVYETTAPVEFKAGEVIGYDGPLDRNQMQMVEIEGKSGDDLALGERAERLAKVKAEADAVEPEHKAQHARRKAKKS
jgi:hypothetical protein